MFRKMAATTLSLTVLVTLSGLATPPPVQAATAGQVFSDGKNTAILRDTTVLLDATSSSHLTQVSPGLLTFNSTNFPQASQLTPGKVVIASSSEGTALMVKVQDTQVTPSGLLLTGTPASVNDAYAYLKVNTVVPFSMKDITATSTGTVHAAAAGSFTYFPSGAPASFTYSFSKSATKKTSTGSASAAGDLTVSGNFAVNPEIGIDVDTSTDTYAFHAAITPTAKVTVSGSASFEASAKINIAKLDFGSKIFWIGMLPVEVHPVVDVTLSMSAKGKASFTATLLNYSKRFQVGVKYSAGDWINDSSMDKTSGFTAPAISGSAPTIDATAVLSADLYIAFYEIAGPTFSISFTLDGHVRPFGNGPTAPSTWAWLNGTLAVTVGGKIEILGNTIGKPFTKQLYSYTWPIWKGTRNPATIKGLASVSPELLRAGINSSYKLTARTVGVSAASTFWTLTAAAANSGTRISTTPTGAKLTSIKGAAVVYLRTGKYNVDTYITVTNTRTILSSFIVDNHILTAPGKPASISATPVYRGADLTWTPPTSGGAVGNYIITATTPDPTLLLSPLERKVIVTIPGGITSYTLRNLTAKVPYTITVQGVNAAGSGPVSSVVATPYDRVHLIGTASTLPAVFDHAADLFLLNSGTSALTTVYTAEAGVPSKVSYSSVLVERSLDTGDILWVSKTADGTPLLSLSTSGSNQDNSRNFLATPDGSTVVYMACPDPGTSLECTRTLYIVKRDTGGTPGPAALNVFLTSKMNNYKLSSWSLSSNGRYLVTVSTAPVEAIRWDLLTGASVSIPWNTTTCGSLRCLGGPVEATISADGSMVLVGVNNAHDPGTLAPCINQEDLWVWHPDSGTKALVSPSQPHIGINAGGYRECASAFWYNSPTLSANGTRAAVILLSSSGAYLDVIDTSTWKSSAVSTLPVSNAGSAGRSYNANHRATPAFSADGTIVAVRVTDTSSPTSYTGVAICVLKAQVCTYDFINTGSPLTNVNTSHIAGAIQLSADCKTLVFYSPTGGGANPAFRWYRQALKTP